MTTPVKIPADVDMADTVLGPLTARQLTILAGTGLGLYLLWAATRAVLPVVAFLAIAIPIGAAAATLALGQRDGISADRLLLAAIRQRLRPCHHVAAPDGVKPAPDWLTAADPDAATTRHAPSRLRLPAEAVTDTGVIDLGADGLAAVAVASTVNFALRTAAEQESLVAGFGRYLHSLTAPVQLLVRTERLDLSSHITELRDRAGALPHPALEAAAREHADYLAHLAQHTDLLRRQVLLVVREPHHTAKASTGRGWTPTWLTRDSDRADTGARRAAESRLARRLSEATDLLAPAGITLTPLDAGRATAVLASACDPDTLLPASTELAAADDVITTPDAAHTDPYTAAWPDREQATTAERPGNCHSSGHDPGDDPDFWDDDTEQEPLR